MPQLSLVLVLLACTGCGFGDHVRVTISPNGSSADDSHGQTVTVDNGSVTLNGKSITLPKNATINVNDDDITIDGKAVSEMGPAIKPSGTPQEEDRKVSEIRGIEIGPEFDLHYRTGPNSQVKVTAAPNILPHIRTTMDGTTLRVTVDANIDIDGKTSVEIVSPHLETLALSGNSVAKCEGLNETTVSVEVSGNSMAELFGKADVIETTISGDSKLALTDFKAGAIHGELSGASTIGQTGSVGDTNLEVSGASTAHLGQISAGRARFELSGGSNVTASGSADRIDVTCSGASSAELSKLQAKNGNAEAEGASSAQVNVTGDLTQDSSGASSINNVHS